MNFNLYLIRNLLDGSMYVGKTSKSISTRWSQHLYAVRNGSKFHLHNAIRLYGANNFTIESLNLMDEDVSDEQSLNKAERLLIRLLRINSKTYNLTDGGEGLSNPSPETRAKISLAMSTREVSPETRAKIGLANRNRTPETRRKISLGNMGRKISAETRSKLSLANSNPSAETRAKIGQAARNASPETRAKIGTSTTQRNHTRWHVNRGIVNPACPLCTQEEK